VRIDGDSDVDHGTTRERFSIDPFVLSSPFLPELTSVNDLRQVYHGFNDIYDHHVQNAKFNSVKGAEFKSLKDRLVSVCHLLKKHPDLPPGKRTELIQAFLAEEDLQRVRQLFPKKDKNKQPGKRKELEKNKESGKNNESVKSSWYSFPFSTIMRLFSGPKGTDEDSLEDELKQITSGVTDSDFLVELKGVGDKDLKVQIRRVVDLACTQLSSSIDATVKKMAHAVLQMQQEECKVSIRREIDADERKVLRDLLVKFIRRINETSARRETS
jgi:hypothetical protein